MSTKKLRTVVAVVIVACGDITNGADAGPDASSSDAAPDASPDAADAAAEACTSATLHVDTLDTSTLTAITIDGAVGAAFLDPSVMADPAPATYLTYSAIDVDGGRYLELATALDGGAHFAHGGTTFGGGGFPCDAGSCSLVLGPATTVDDPGAPLIASVKTFTQVYLMDPSASPSTVLARGYIAKSDDYGFQLGSPNPWIRWNDDPVAQAATVDLRGFPALAACTAFGEPSAIARPTSMDLALTCRTATGTSIVLLRSTDHAQSFTFVSTLLANDDAIALGGVTLDVMSPELFDAGGKSYLLVSTASGVDASLPTPDACVTVELSSADAVARDCAGHPVVTRRMVESQHLPFGSCTHARDGYLATVYDASKTPSSRVVATGIAGP